MPANIARFPSGVSFRWIGTGVYADLADAVDRTVHVIRAQEPRSAQVEYRDQRYQRYLAAVHEEVS